MLHEPSLGSAGLAPRQAADRGPGPAELLAELERRCLGLKVSSGELDSLLRFMSSRLDVSLPSGLRGHSRIPKPT